MTAFLLFRLYGPLASWGEIAVGERRGSWSRPSKSAVLGLVAAALGLDRADTAAQAAVAAGYGFAVRVDAPGVALRDYHTAQTAREAHLNQLRQGDPRPLTRRRLLSVKAPETILSQRDYYADALYTVALWERASSPHSLAELKGALMRPKFVLYLGRKSCPPALPLAPDLVETPDLLAALAKYRPPEPLGIADLAGRLNRHGAPTLLAWEDAVVPVEAVDRLHTERRRDNPQDRARWQFSERDEQVAILP